MAKKTKEFFHNGPQGASGILFRQGNFPRESVFKDLFDSIVFSQNSSDSASLTNSGHARIDSDGRAISRSEPNNEWTKFIQSHQLPNLYLEALSEHTAGTPETYGHLQITPLTYLYTSGRTRKDFLIESILTLASADASVTVTPTATGWDLSVDSDTYKIMLNAADTSPDYIENKLGTSLEVVLNLLEVKYASTTSVNLANTASGITATLRIDNSQTTPIRNYISTGIAGGLYSSLLYDTNTLEVDPITFKLGSIFERDFINNTGGHITITPSDASASPTYRTWNIELNPSAISTILGFRYTPASENIQIGNTYTVACSGSSNLFVGANSGSSQIGDDNIAIGRQTLQNNAGYCNIAIGVQSGYHNIANNCNFFGFQMGYNNTSSNRIEIGNTNSNALPFIAGDMATGRREYRMTTGGSSLSSIANVYDVAGAIANGDSKILFSLPLATYTIANIELTVLDVSTLKMNKGTFISNGITVEMISDKYCCDDESSSSIDNTPIFSINDDAGYVSVYISSLGILVLKNNSGNTLNIIGEIKYYSA